MSFADLIDAVQRVLAWYVSQVSGAFHGDRVPPWKWRSGGEEG